MHVYVCCISIHPHVIDVLIFLQLLICYAVDQSLYTHELFNSSELLLFAVVFKRTNETLSNYEAIVFYSTFRTYTG